MPQKKSQSKNEFQINVFFTTALWNVQTLDKQNKHDGVKEETHWLNPVLLCAELAGFDTGVNTKALEYRDNKSDTRTGAHASAHARTPASQKESSALAAREHMSLQPTWDSEQRKETATPVTAHAWGQTHTHTPRPLYMFVCMCLSDREAAKGLSLLLFFPFLLPLLEASTVNSNRVCRKQSGAPTPERRISL